jgi:uncharacterized repeat protein (TIGR01451 family)
MSVTESNGSRKHLCLFVSIVERGIDPTCCRNDDGVFKTRRECCLVCLLLQVLELAAMPRRSISHGRKIMSHPGNTAALARSRPIEKKPKWRRFFVIGLGLACVPLLVWGAPAPYAGSDQIILPVNSTVTTLANGQKNLLANDGVVASSAHLMPLVPKTYNHIWGSLTVNADGTFTATRNSSMVTGVDTYTVGDSNGGFTNGSIDIRLAPVNSKPSLPANLSMHVHPNGTATRFDSGDASFFPIASDPQGDSLDMSFSSASHGILIGNISDGTFKYTSNQGAAFSSDTFDFSVCEKGGGLCDATGVNVIIDGTHAPSAVDDQIQVAKGGTITTLVGGGTKLTGNDFDLDAGETSTLTAGRGQLLGFGKINANVGFSTGGGLVTINSDGTFSYKNTNVLASSDSFKYYACDTNFVCSIGTVAVTLTNGAQAQNHLPVAGDDAIQMLAGGTSNKLVGGASSLLANDADQDAAEILSARWVSDPDYGTVTINSNGTFSYKNTMPVSQDSFHYQACDNQGACRVAAVYITLGSAAPDHAPVVIDDAIQVLKGATATSLIGDTVGNSVLDNDFDSDQISGDTLEVTLLASPAGQLTLNPNGTFSYKAPAAATTDSFYYQACDLSHACSVGKVTITVTNSPQPLNRAPWVVDDALQVAPSGVVTQLVGGATRLHANDRDPDGDLTLTVSARSAPEKGVLNFVHADGTFNYTAAASAYSDGFFYQVCDTQGACTAGKATITVSATPSNHLPTAGDDAIQALPASGVTQRLIGGAIPTSSVIGNDMDTDGDSLTVRAISPQLDPVSGSITLNSNGTFSYTTPASEAQDTFAYEVCDIFGACAPGLIAINVTTAPPDNLPSAHDDFILVKPNSGVTHALANGHVNVLDNDTDLDGDLVEARAISAVSTASGQKMVLYPDGSFDYTAPSVEMADSLSYQACDSFGACSVAKIDMLVRQAAPLLAIEKSAQPGTFVGGSGSYRIAVSNIGTASTVGAISVDDPLPTGVTRVGFSGSGWNCASQSSQCVYSGTALAPGESTILTLTVAVASGTQNANNTATVSGGGDNTCPSDHCKASVIASASDTPVPILNVAVNAVPGTFVLGTTGSYQITVSDTGGVAATSVSLHDVLPPGVVFNSAAGPGWACNVQGFVSCAYAPSLPAGASTTVTINVSIAANAVAGSTAASDTAVIFGGDASCPAASHCNGSVVAGISATAVPILSVSKSATPATFVVGQSASYPITITNAGGAATSAQISVQDTLPPGVTYSNVVGANWSCTSGKTITCNYPASGLNALAPGMSTTATVFVNVGASAIASDGASNTAIASGGGDTTCPQATHCRGSVIAGVSSTAVPILSLTKIANEGTFVGGAGSYSISVTNTGGAPTNGNIVLHDALAPGIQLMSATGANWNCAGSSDVICTRSAASALEVGASTTLTLNVSVSGPSNPIGASNTAMVSGGGDTSCPAATHCSVSVVAGISTTPVPILTISKTAAPGTFVVGQAASYVFSIKNIGTVAASGAITLSDSLPPGIGYVGFGGQGWSSCTSSPLVCTTSAPLAPGASSTLTVNVSVSAGAVGTTGANNTAALSGGGDPTCPMASHCRGSVIAGVSNTAVPVLTAVMTPNPTTFVAGQQGSYTIGVQNFSTVSTTAFTLADALPPGLSLFSYAGAGWTCSGTETVICTHPAALTPLGTQGNQAALSLVVSVDPIAVGPAGADNTIVLGGGADPSCAVLPPASHCTVRVNVPVQSPPLSAPVAALAFSPPQIPLGGVSALTITVSNPNAVPLSGIALTDSYPLDGSGNPAMWNTPSGALLANSCNGNVVAASGASAVTLTGGSIPANGACNVIVAVVGFGVGNWTNHTGTISTTTPNAPNGADAAGTLEILANPSPQTIAPLAVDDGVIAMASQPVSIVNGNMTSVLGNDMGDAGHLLRAFIHGATTAKGSLTLLPDGSLTYTSNMPGATSDSFQYDACDATNGLCATATVHITILQQGPLPTVLMPIPANDGSVVNVGGTASQVNGTQKSVLDNDVDPNSGGTLSAKLVGPTPSSGTVQLNLSGQPAGSFKYTHDGISQASQDAFFYEACDVQFNVCALAKVNITIVPAGDPLPVVHLPLVVNDAIVVQALGTATQVNGGSNSVLGNDSDPNGGTLSAILVGNGPSNGQLSVFTTQGNLSYQNNAGTSDGFQYQACDDLFGTCSIGTVNITVTPTPPPTIFLPAPINDSASVAVGGSISVVNANQTSVLDNDGPDPNGGVLNAYVIGGGPAHGTLSNFDDLGHFTYQHDGTPAPSDSFTYQACDSKYHVCKSATVVITVGSGQGNAPGITCVLPKQVYSVGEAVNIDMSKLFSTPAGQSLAYSATGMPAGLNVGVGSIFLAGTPQVPGQFPLVLTATAQPSQASANQNVMMEVLAAQERLFQNGFDGTNKPCQ